MGRRRTGTPWGAAGAEAYGVVDSPGIATGAPGKAREYGEDALKLDLTVTLLELGDATSRNLEFSHRGDVWVS